jgi:hypothetical protein
MPEANNSTQPYGYTLPPEEVVEETTEVITPQDPVLLLQQYTVEAQPNFPGDLRAAQISAAQRLAQERPDLLPEGAGAEQILGAKGEFYWGERPEDDERRLADLISGQEKADEENLLNALPADQRRMYEHYRKTGNFEAAQGVLGQYAPTHKENIAAANALRQDANLGQLVEEGAYGQGELQGLREIIDNISAYSGGGTAYKALLADADRYAKMANSGLFSPQQTTALAKRETELREEMQLMNEELEPTPRNIPGVIGTQDYTDDQLKLKELTTYYNDARKAADDNFKLDMSGGGGAAGTVLSAISVAMGAYASGILGGPNQALSIVQKHIDRDIKRQYKKQQKKIDNLGLDFQQQTLMLDMVRKDRLQLYGLKMQELASIATTKEQQLRLNQLATQTMGMAAQAAPRANPKVALAKGAMKIRLAQGLDPLGKGSKTTADQRKLSREQNTIRNHIIGTREAFNKAKKTTSWAGQWVASLGSEAGLYRDVVRGLGWMNPDAGSYYNKRTSAIATVVKILQGSRPSDFDWQKLDILFPQLPDSEDLADADFNAMMEVAEMTLNAEAVAKEIVAREGISMEDAFVHEDNAAGRKIEQLGNALHNGGSERLADNVSGMDFHEARSRMQGQSSKLQDIVRTHLGGTLASGE